MQYRCASCRQSIDVPKMGAGLITCRSCNHQYNYALNYLCYDFDSLLFKRFGKQYLLNKVLNNNAYLSYLFLKEASISLPQRQDVIHFRKFILSHVNSGRLLDVGCGLLEVPGYLDFEDKSKFEFFGIDPVEDRSFRGMRIVGCSEFMPFEDEQFDALIFATSLDHVCSLEYTISESYRILVHGGKVLIWMSDHRQSLLRWSRSWLGTKLMNVKKGYRTDKFVTYPNRIVFYRPHGAVDPFHAFLETPRAVISLMGNKFRLSDSVSNNRDEVFLCFSKTRANEN
jgi:SAM-dependent methyltransferase